MGSDIEVFILAAPGREESQRRCLDSIEASDIGDCYMLCMQPAEITPREHWSATFARMAASSTPLVLLLEDDCLVNEAILHNLRTWPAIGDPDFGAGWAYNPGGYGNGEDCWYNGTPVWYGTVGVLYWTRDVAGLCSRAERWMDQHDTAAWDAAMSVAIHEANLRIRIHGPAIVEHQFPGPSLLGHQHSPAYGTTRGTFRPSWRRRGSAVPLVYPDREPVELVEPDAPILAPDTEVSVSSRS